MRRPLYLIAILLGLTIGPIAQLVAAPVELETLMLNPGQVQPIECETELLGTLDRVECREQPVAAETCPAWLHDEWTATGPDGKEYATWHPPVDPSWGCFYRHEHGVDPSYFHPDYQALYGYTAASHGMDEPHAGFKTYVWDNPDGTVRWLVTQHFGTSGIGRVCTRFHTFDVAAVDTSTHEIVADLHVMGDYGIAINARTGATLKPASCPDQGEIRSDGRRQLQVQVNGIVNYEPWRLANVSLPLLGFTSGHFTINTTDLMTACDTDECAQLISTGNKGARRFIQDNGLSNGHFGIRNAQQSGIFYTDPHGKEIGSETDAHAVQQYIAPGFSTVGDQVYSKCKDVYGDGRPLVCDGSSVIPKPPYYESLQAPN